MKLALPAGDLRAPLAAALAARGLSVGGYGEGSRAYRLGLGGREDVTVRVFREKDIPIQIALGNYDLGVCNSMWVEEMRVRYPAQPLVLLRELDIGRQGLYVVAAAEGPVRTVEALASRRGVRIASEYANLAEAFAIAARLAGYRLQPVWGAAEAYPPEDADIAVVAAADEDALRAQGLAPLFRLLEGSGAVIANADSLREKDLGPLLAPLTAGAPAEAEPPRLRLPRPAAIPAGLAQRREAADRTTVRLGLPDGHQQPNALAALRAAGLQLEGYDESRCERRPRASLAGLEVKVVRPHDMPQLVATGEMDLAITGRDCLMEHVYRFPSSPVEELADLQRGGFDLSAVVSEEVPARSLGEALDYWRGQGRTVLRLASEFPAIADHYARANHLGRYRVIPIAGASEGFVPEDAEILIEGTETGKTLAENRLKVIEPLFRSTTRLIGRRGGAEGMSGRRRQAFETVVAGLRRSAEAAYRSAGV